MNSKNRPKPLWGFVGLLAALSLAANPVEAHMPMFVFDKTEETKPVDLGDITKNSWAAAFHLAPKEVKYFKFNIGKHVESSSTGVNRFYTGLYVPSGDREKDFRFYVAFYGMKNDTKCERWGQGWGRRLEEDNSNEKISNSRSLVHGVEDTVLADEIKTDQLLKVGNSEGIITKTANGVEFLRQGSAATIPKRVYSSESSNFHPKGDDVMVLVADPKTKLHNKYEAFTPTVFVPRGSCIADFPRSGDYYIAVFGDDDQKETFKGSLGLGLAERDVFSPTNLILMDYILWNMHIFNYWTPGQMLAPILTCIALVLLVVGGNQMVKQKKEKVLITFSTANNLPTLFQTICLIVGAAFIGQAIQTIALMVWASSIAEPEGQAMVVTLGIIIPFLNGVLLLLIGFGKLFLCGCCGMKCDPMPDKRAMEDQNGNRVTIAIIAAFHLFGWHCGYIVGPVLLFVASMLPNRIASKGLILPGGRVNENLAAPQEFASADYAMKPAEKV